jgi:hypothetical protein
VQRDPERARAHVYVQKGCMLRYGTQHDWPRLLLSRWTRRHGKTEDVTMAVEIGPDTGWAARIKDGCPTAEVSID